MNDAQYLPLAIAAKLCTAPTGLAVGICWQYTHLVQQSSRTRLATLVFVRHGHVGDNDSRPDSRLCGWLDPPLSPLGWVQAEQLGARLAAGPPVDALYTSSLRRAQQSAEVLAGRLGLRPRLLDSLREIHCGVLEGVTLIEVQRRYPALWQQNLAQSDDAFCWPGGESYRAFRARVLRAVRRLAAVHTARRIMIVTHAGVISQVVGALHGSSAARWEAFRAGNASITEVQWQGGAGWVTCFDDRAHLSACSAAPQRVGAADHA